MYFKIYGELLWERRKSNYDTHRGTCPHITRRLCRQKVDYGVDTEVKSQNVVSSVKDIDTNTSFNDELTVNMGGTDEKVKITADIRVPECDTMSVTEVERIPCTKEFKEKVIKAYFGDSQVYYYDYAHMTKRSLRRLLRLLTGTTTVCRMMPLRRF